MLYMPSAKGPRHTDTITELCMYIPINPITVKESTSNAASVANIFYLIGSLKITCKMIDTSYQLSYHAAYQLEQVSGQI